MIETNNAYFEDCSKRLCAICFATKQPQKRGFLLAIDIIKIVRYNEVYSFFEEMKDEN
jgi:hypothetical protein